MANINVIDKRNYLEWEVWGSDNTEIQDTILLLNTPFQNQGSSMACSCFTAWHLGTELDFFDTKQTFKGFYLWDIRLARGASDIEGWNNLARLKMMKDLWIISVFTQARNLQEYILAMNKWGAWFLGTNKCDWKKTGETWVFTYTPNWYWHFFAWIGYDLSRKVLICKNSWWENWGKQWLFEVPFNQVENLFALYVVYDKKENFEFEIKEKRRKEELKNKLLKIIDEKIEKEKKEKHSKFKKFIIERFNFYKNK